MKDEAEKANVGQFVKYLVLLVRTLDFQEMGSHNRVLKDQRCDHICTLGR